MPRTISSAINGTLALVTADNPLTIANAGSVTATASGADAIDGGSGTAWSITNNGGIASSLGYGVFLNGTGSSISNSGSISGQGAVHLVSGASVTNTSGGTIKATGTSGFSAIAGVQISGSGTVNNAGTISAAGTGYGVSLDNGGTVTNSGSITGGEDGVVISGAGGQLINTGKITATVDDGVSVVGSVVNGVGASISALSTGGFGPAAVYTPTGTGSLQNDGSIAGAKYGVYFSAGGSVINGANSASASISGGSYGIYVTGGSGTVTNAGTISGGSLAVYFASNSASNKVVVEPGAVFNGAVSGGQGTLELASGLASISGISSSGAFSNFQSLLIDAGGTWTLNGANNSVASVTNNGTLVVTGSCKISTAIDASSSGQFQLGVAGASCTLEVASETGSRSQTNFLGNGKLIIDSAGTFGANVGTSSYTGPLLESFAAGDTIQILNFSASGATISFDGSTGLAQISNATQKATLDFQTSSLGSGGLQLASDGGTGIFVTLSLAAGPRVSSIATSGTGISSGNGDLNAGKVVTLTVNFSAAVTVNTAGGTPTLSLNDGGTATYTAGSGTPALTFSTTVAAGQNTPDLVVSSFNLNGATVKDAAGNVADLSGASNYNPVGTLQIDTVAPLPVFSQEPPAVTNSNTAAFAFATSNNETSGVSYAYKLDTATTWSPVTGNALSLSGLATGSHTLQVQATDAAGNVSGAASFNWTITTSVPVAQIENQFSGPSVTSAYPPHNGLAVGPNNVVMMDGSRIEWTNLAGGSPTLQSVYTFFSLLGSTAANSLNHPRSVYDSVNQRYVVIMDNSASGRTISNIDIAVSKDSNPNDGWYFASLNTSLTINGQLTSADSPTLSVDGTNIYIAATMYNVNVTGSPGTESWVIGDTAGAGGGIYSGGTLTVTASQFMPANNGTFAVATGGSGKTYYASSYSSGSQIVVALQAYDAASNTFGPISTIGLGNIDQGGSYTAQQLGTSLPLDAGDKQARSLVYANGFLYGVTEIKPIGSSVPEVHWFKIDLSNPNAPTLAAQGDISGAAIGTNVATFNGSIALDASGDVLVNFTASGPNMYPGDYYVYQRGSDPPGTFSAPALYQASTGFFDSGNGASVQPWGRYSTAIVDPNNPNSFWLSNEYVANGWWQTAVARVAIETAEVPTLTIANTALTVTAGGSVPLGITATPVDSDDTLSLKISGVPTYETITAPSGITVTSSRQADGTNTWTVTEGAATTGAPLTALTLSSSYTGSDHPIATLNVTATNTTLGETATSAAQTITVTDPPAMTSGVQSSTSPGEAIAASSSNPGQIDRLVALMDQFTAAGFHEDRTGAGAITSTLGSHLLHADFASLAVPRFHHASAR